MRRTIIFLISLCLLSCQHAPPTRDGIITIGIGAAPLSFDPRLATDAAGQKINKLMYNGLMRVGDDLKLVPDLAASFELQDGTVYTFHLRENIVFHNQKILTSHDVKATYDSMRDVKLASPFKSNLDIIDEISTPDDKTIVFKIKNVNSPFLTVMTLGIVPQEIASLPKAEFKPCGTGPYILENVAEDLSEVHLKTFDAHFKGRNKNNGLVFRVLLDPTLRTLELKKGRLDFALNETPWVLIPALQSEPHLNFESATGINFSYMAFNFKNPYLKNLQVRQAISLSIDRDRIIKYKMMGLGTKAASLLVPSHWAYNMQLTPSAFDPQKARELLDSAGFKDPDGDGPLKRFTIVYKTSSVKERVEIAQLIAENLEAVGIGVEIKSYEFGTFYRDIRQGDFDVFTLSWVGLTDPDIYYTAFHSTMLSPKGANRGSYVNPVLDALLDNSRGEVDVSKNTENYREIQKIVADDVVYAPLWYENNFVITSKKVRGFKLRPDASYINVKEAIKD